MIQKLWSLWQDYNVKMKKTNIATHAASTAFFFFLSLAPILMVVCTILPYTPIAAGDLIALAGEIVPVQAKAMVTELIEDVYHKSVGALSVAILITIWSAGKGVMALMRGLNAINGVEEKRNYFLIRLIASFYTVVMLIVLILFLAIMVFGNQLVQIILHQIPHLQRMASLYMEFRFLLVWPLLTLLFAALYAYIPNKKLPLKEQIPGAGFAAVVWSVFSWGFSLYVSGSGAFGVYGSLSIIVIVMLWMYIGMYIVMLGAWWNNYFNHTEESVAEKPKQ